MRTTQRRWLANSKLVTPACWQYGQCVSGQVRFVRAASRSARSPRCADLQPVPLRAEAQLDRARAQQPADTRVEEIGGERLEQHAVAASGERLRDALGRRCHHQDSRGRLEPLGARADVFSAPINQIELSDDERRRRATQVVQRGARGGRGGHSILVAQHRHVGGCHGVHVNEQELGNGNGRWGSTGKHGFSIDSLTAARACLHATGVHSAGRLVSRQLLGWVTPAGAPPRPFGTPGTRTTIAGDSGARSS